jgi:Domain of unknown function (DUF1918)
MQAEMGDRLIANGDPDRVGLVIAVPHADGTPPYIIKWLSTGHIAMVSPGQFSRILPAEHPATGSADHKDAAWSGTNVGDSRGARM